MSTTREQFEKEAAALVQLIQGMIEAGQLAEAGELLGQYALLNPSDPQIAELKETLAAASAAAAGDAAAASPDAPSFLDNIDSVYVLAGITAKRSGFYTSIFGKIKLMEERLGYESTILTCRHDINLRKTEVWLKTFTGSQQVLGSGTEILNVYEHFQGSYAQGLENKAVYSKPGDDGLRYEKMSDVSYAVYDGDKRVRLDIYNGYSGSLRMERHYKDTKAEKDIYYDDWGYLNNVVEYDRDNADIYTVKYYTTAGELCIEALFDKKYNEFEPKRLFVYDESGEKTAEYESNEELAAAYLSQVMRDDRFYLLNLESGTMSKFAAILGDGYKNVAKVCVVHSIFLKDAYNPKSGPQMFYEGVCNNPALYDGIVFLTEEARREFIKLYGNGERTFTIAHPYPYEIVKNSFDERDAKKAIVISRLFPEKQIDVTVDIFSAVVRKLPDVRLEIYGFGPEREKIEARIKKLGMENNIFLMGYTDDAIAIYRGAALSIMTSMAEGYGLTIMESICNGCPAFSHDIKYGPSEIIEEGKTGFLFPRNDKREFSKKIIEYFEDPKLQREMSENCYADAPRFSEEIFLEKWLEMMGKVYNLGIRD